MPTIRYTNKSFRAKQLVIIHKANEIVQEYMAQGFNLTLRQLYYQFVSRALIPNSQNEYDKLGRVVSEARLAGLIDWDAIEDRTRFVRSLSHWDEPSSIIKDCANQFRIDRWETQHHHVEVWIEKDALVGVIEGVCHGFDVPFFSCRGYVSQSEMWAASQRLIASSVQGRSAVIIHLGDHDPSGIDMTRDIQDRLYTFEAEVEVIRVALNRDQINKYKPPPNPAKISDSRFAEYCRKHGSESWELDALEPSVLVDIIREEIEKCIDAGEWKATEKQENQNREELQKVSDQWSDLIQNLR